MPFSCSQKSYLGNHLYVECEISPMLSYAGEVRSSNINRPKIRNVILTKQYLIFKGLEELVNGKKFTPPLVLYGTGEAAPINGKMADMDSNKKNGDCPL